jgi:hypothetical protein
MSSIPSARTDSITCRQPDTSRRGGRGRSSGWEGGAYADEEDIGTEGAGTEHRGREVDEAPRRQDARTGDPEPRS